LVAGAVSRRMRRPAASDGEENGGWLFGGFGAELGLRGVGRVFLLFEEIALGFVALFFCGLVCVFEVVGEDGSVGRVVGSIEGFPLPCFAGVGEGKSLDVDGGVLHGEERVGVGEFVAEGGVVVEDVEAAAEGGEDEIAFAGLNGDVTDGDGGESALEACPGFAAVVGEVDAVFAAYE